MLSHDIVHWISRRQVCDAGIWCCQECYSWKTICMHKYVNLNVCVNTWVHVLVSNWQIQFCIHIACKTWYHWCILWNIAYRLFHIGFPWFITDTVHSMYLRNFSQLDSSWKPAQATPRCWTIFEAASELCQSVEDINIITLSRQLYTMNKQICVKEIIILKYIHHTSDRQIKVILFL
jgi:hypothetical protein